MRPQYIIQSDASNTIITWCRDKESGIDRFKKILQQEGKNAVAVRVKKIRESLA